MVRKISILRMIIQGSSELDEKTLRSVGWDLFLKKLWEEDRISFQVRTSYNWKKDAEISIEIPESGEHYQTKTGSEWLKPEDVIERTSMDLINYQVRVDEFNKVRRFVKILEG